MKESYDGFDIEVLQNNTGEVLNVTLNRPNSTQVKHLISLLLQKTHLSKEEITNIITTNILKSKFDSVLNEEL